MRARSPNRPLDRVASAILASALVSGLGHAGAQDVSRALGLADLERLAEAHNPTLAQANAGLDAARARALQAGLYPNPMIGYFSQQVGEEGTSGQQGAFLTQTIVTGGKLRLNREEYAREADVVRWQASAQALRVRNAVRVRFWEVVALREAADGLETLIGRADEALRAVEARGEAGRAGEADRIEARQEKRLLEDVRDETLNRHEAGWRRLAALVGVPDLAPSPVVAELEAEGPPLDHDAALAVLLEASPELAIARAHAVRGHAALRREQVEPIPNLALELATAYNAADERAQAYAQLGFSVPIFDRNQGNIRSAQAELVRASAGVRRVELNLRARLANAFEQYKTARDDVAELRDERLPDAQALLDLRLAGVKAGEDDWPRLQQALRGLARDRQAYLQALLDLRRAEVAIGGLLLVDELDEPPPPPSRGQPLRNREQEFLQESLQQPLIGEGGRRLEDRLGNQFP